MDDIDVSEFPWVTALADLEPDVEALPGITAGRLLELFHPKPSPPGCRWVAHVYRSVADHDLKAYGYAQPEESGAPAIVFVHGGGWSSGDPSFHLRHCHALAERGWTALTITYRLHPGITWPDPHDDVRAALAWVRSNATALGADGTRLVVSGGSAGGHLTLMAALDNPDPPTAAIAIYPPVDLDVLQGSALDEILDPVFGPAGGPVRREASPIEHVRSGAPPILTITGDADQLIALAPLEDMHTALDAASVPNQLHVVAGGDHGFDFTEAGWDEAFEVMLDFLERTVPTTASPVAST